MPVAVGVLLAATLAVPGYPTRPRLEVNMEVERGVTLPDAELRAIAAEARGIWAPALDLAINLPSAASRPITKSIRLVVTERMLNDREHTGLGWIDFVGEQPQPTITVSIAAARRLLESSSWRGRSFQTLPRRASRLFLQRALARAVAHEVGHYVRRAKTHDRKGLMRASFTADEIMDRPAHVDPLEPAVVARLRETAPMVARAADGDDGDSLDSLIESR
jgi:hypothetical protein